MAVDAQKIWITREFGGQVRDLALASTTFLDDAKPLGLPWYRLSRYARSNNDHFGRADQSFYRQAGQERRDGSDDGSRADDSPFSGTGKGRGPDGASQFIGVRESQAVEAGRKDHVLDATLAWLQNNVTWFFRKEAYPDFDRIMLEARQFAKNPDATMVPLAIHPLRRNWADKVMGGDDDE